MQSYSAALRPGASCAETPCASGNRALRGAPPSGAAPLEGAPRPSRPPCLFAKPSCACLRPRARLPAACPALNPCPACPTFVPRPLRGPPLPASHAHRSPRLRRRLMRLYLAHLRNCLARPPRRSTRARRGAPAPPGDRRAPPARFLSLWPARPRRLSLRSTLTYPAPTPACRSTVARASARQPPLCPRHPRKTNVFSPLAHAARAPRARAQPAPAPGPMLATSAPRRHHPG
ncbi:MAG: hypothetical protein J3K34DRAFT_407022 [Monoraphidium minutum]|nr:MAG: hypothetical protein J3K34DRAFT_407022 [Monoraphidium minutum]